MKIRRLAYRYVATERLLEIQNWINRQSNGTKDRKKLDRLLDHNMDIFYAVLWKNRRNVTFVDQACNRIIETLEGKTETSS